MADVKPTTAPNDHPVHQPPSRAREGEEEGEEEERGRCKRHKTSARNAFSVLMEAARAPLVFAPFPGATQKEKEQELCWEEDREQASKTADGGGEKDNEDFRKEGDEIPMDYSVFDVSCIHDRGINARGRPVGAPLAYQAPSRALIPLFRRLVTKVEAYSGLIGLIIAGQRLNDKRKRVLREVGESPLQQMHRGYMLTTCTWLYDHFLSREHWEWERFMACGQRLRKDTLQWIVCFLQAEGVLDIYEIPPSLKRAFAEISRQKGSGIFFTNCNNGDDAWHRFLSLLGVSDADMQAWWTGVNISSHFSERAFILHLRSKLLPLVHKLAANKLEQAETRTTEQDWSRKRVLELDVNQVLDDLLALPEEELRQSLAFTQGALKVVAVLNAEPDEQAATRLTPHTVRKRKVADTYPRQPDEEQEAPKRKGGLMDHGIMAKGRELSLRMAAIVRERISSAVGLVDHEEPDPERIRCKGLDSTAPHTASWSVDAGLKLDASGYTMVPHTVDKVVVHYCGYWDQRERRQYLDEYGRSEMSPEWITGVTTHFKSGETRVDGYSDRRGESGSKGLSKELKLRDGEVLIAVKGTSEFLEELHAHGSRACTHSRSWQRQDRHQTFERRRLMTISFRVYNQKKKTQRVWTSNQAYSERLVHLQVRSRVTLGMKSSEYAY